MYRQQLSREHYAAIQALYPVASYDDIRTLMEHSNMDDFDAPSELTHLRIAQNDDDNEPPPARSAFAIHHHHDLVEFMTENQR